jgi:alkylation response protein AidB-like acyl-CoA dehydrogenase
VDFGFSQEQEQLRSVAREFLRKEAPPSHARALMERDSVLDERMWKALAEMGWLGLTIPESFGGSGLGLLELAIVLEEMGEVVFPGPFWSTVALGVPAVVALGDQAQQERLLGEVVAGRHRITVAAAERSGRWSASDIETTARATTGGFELDGAKLFVPDAASADTILVVARVDAGYGFFAMPAGTAAARVEPMHTVDRTRRLDVVELRGVTLPRSALLGSLDRGAQALESLAASAKTVLAAELCGLASASLAMSVDYVKVREQFGRPIATFQAIQHKLADMKVGLENSRSLVYYAAWALDTQSDDRYLAAAMAKAYASDECPRVVAEAIQVHGGIGFTWEHDLQLYFKRAKADQVTFGDATENRETVARLLEL